MQGNYLTVAAHIVPHRSDQKPPQIRLILGELSAAFSYPHISSFYTKVCSFPWKKYADKNYLSPQMRASSSSLSGHS